MTVNFMEPTSPDFKPTVITRIEVEASDELQVDSKCEMPSSDRWQVALFAALAIAIVSGVMYGVSYLAQKLGS